MLDVLLIQHAETGINLIEYHQEGSKFDAKHSDIFSGFLSAIQNVSEEIDIGTLILLSTEGSRGHNCLIIPRDPINVIILVDQEDPTDLWREQGTDIAEKFIDRYGKSFQPNNVDKFKEFIPTIRESCMGHRYCD